MEYPHQQYMQYRQQQQPQHSTSQQQQQQRGPVYVHPYEAAGGDPRGTRPTQAMHVGTADNELPMTAPSSREAAVESLQALAQCGREEALYYLAEHDYDVHRAMAARTADVRWELQRGCALPRPAPEQPQPQERVAQVGPASLQAQLEEARQRLRTRYERETGDTSSSPGALALPLRQPQPTLTTALPAAQPPAASAPPLVYFPSPAAGAPPQYAAPHFPAQQVQPYTPTAHVAPPTQASAPSHHYPQQLQQQPVLYPPPTPTYAPLQQPQHGWEEASREEANINAGTARRENPLTLAGQTLGKWIWGGTHHKDKSGSSSSYASSSTPTSSTTTSTTHMGPPAPLQSSVSSSAFYPTTSTVPVGEERSGLGMGRRYQSDDSLEINELARDRRSRNGTARDEEASTEEREGESRGGLRHLLSSVRHRGREIVDRIGHHQATPGEPQQLTPASEEEELESRRGHRRRSSHSTGGGSSAGKREKRASLDEGWVLVDNTPTRSSTSTHPPQPTLVTQVPLTDEQYAARLSRQLAEEEERQRRRDEELARRIQRQEEEEVRRRAREAEQEAEQRDNTRSSGRSRRRSHGPVHVVVSRGPFGEVLVSEGLSPSTLYIDEPRGRRRRTGGLVGLLEMMREMHEMSLAQNMSQESGYPFVLAPNASDSSRRQDMTYEQLLGLAERVGNVNRGVSHAAMDALPTRTFQEKDKKADQEDNKCTICLCDYEEGDTLRALPCLHSYHKDCIDHWLKSHNTCPVCKTQINM